mgnify:CR=1 FL=1
MKKNEQSLAATLKDCSDYNQFFSSSSVISNAGRNSLINIVSNQVNQRISDLPSSTKQTIIIDVRGQQITNDVLRQIRTSILEKCNTDVLIQFMR